MKNRTIVAFLCGLAFCCTADSLAAQRNDPVKDRVTAFFRRYDANQDRFVTEREVGARLWREIAAADANQDQKVSFDELYRFWSRSGGNRCEVKMGTRSCGGLLTGVATTGSRTHEIALDLTRDLPGAVGLVLAATSPRTVTVGNCVLFPSSTMVGVGVINTDRSGAATTKVGIPRSLAGSFSLQALTLAIARNQVMWQSTNTLNVICSNPR